MRKGFINIFAILLGATLLIASGLIYEKSRQNNLGATVYTTQLSDTINTFRQQVNSSTANLNAELTLVSTTVNAYGNIVSENVPLAVNKGGTGSTTAPTDAQFWSAVGTTPTWKSLVFGAGLNATNTQTSTQIGTAGFDNTANISFTGNNTHAGTETFNATTTFSASTTFNSTTTFQISPQILKIPVNASDTVQKSYNDAHAPTFLSVLLADTNAFGTSETGLGTSTLSLTYPGHVLVAGTGTAHTGNGGSCILGMKIDGQPWAGFDARFVNEAGTGNGIDRSLNFTAVVSSTLSTGSHTFALTGTAGAGTCAFTSYYVYYEFLGI